jgi:sugar (pentulose or hexulose) kinase
MKQNAILIFDVGKTNKKIFLFNEQYKIVFEESQKFEEIKDEDGFACEDLQALSKWISEKFQSIAANKDYNVHAVNFSAYGASFVHLDDAYKPLTPLYNYLKPYPENLKKQFYNTYGEEDLIAKQTASPVLGNLNSGMQLYRLKYEQPEIFSRLKFSLHLPQYLSFIISKKLATDISSVGCHTGLWHFEKKDYHAWVYKEALYKKFAPLYNGDKLIATIDNNIKVGVGLHDSSAALIPYLASFNESFILLSTGTWNISLNPFNDTPLTDEELKQDCLCYLSYKGVSVKASRLFAGYELEDQISRIASHFNQRKEKYLALKFDINIFNSLRKNKIKRRLIDHEKFMIKIFSQRNLNEFKNDLEDYYQLIVDLVMMQFASTELILQGTFINKIFVDGGFSKNEIFMQLLALAFPGIEVYAANIAQASALGAAFALHEHLSKDDLPSKLIELKYYAANDVAI